MQTAVVPTRTSPLPAGRASRCRACGTEVSGNFCAECGEATKIHVPSAGEFLHEFIGHFVALEGKLWKTVQFLLFRPGQLTVEFLGGRRIPFIPPLRLYLTLSLVFFALIKIFGIELPHIALDNNSIGVTYSHFVPSKMQTAMVSFNLHEAINPVAHSGAVPESRTFSQDIRETIGFVGTINPAWMDKLTGFMAHSDEKKAAILNHGFLAYLPYMLIGTLPLFAST